MHHTHRRLRPSLHRARSRHTAGAPHRRALIAIAGGIGLAGAIVTPQAHAQAADEDSRAAWSTRVTVNRTAGELGLRAGAPRSALARAGARRGAAMVGVSRAELGGLQRLPRRAGDPAGVTHLRQTIGGLRVLWSQLDVLADDRKVTAVSGTLLPAKRTFGSVHRAFEDATLALNMGQYKSIVHDAFIAQGVTTSKTRTGTCPNANP